MAKRWSICTACAAIIASDMSSSTTSCVVAFESFAKMEVTLPCGSTLGANGYFS